jgi:putative oxidoreductase
MKTATITRQAKPETIGRATALIRLVVGGVFLAEGILKFLYPDELAAGRFAKIGIPVPQVMGPFVGGVEILFGAFVVIGWLTRLAAVLWTVEHCGERRFA